MYSVPLPAYSEVTCIPPAPPYSFVAEGSSGHVEPRLHVGVQDGNSFSTDDFQYHRDLIHIRLDRSRWRLRTPAYGFNGSVDGVVRLDYKLTRAVKVTATLKGKIKISVMERGVVASAIESCILLQQAVLYSSSIHIGSPYGQDLAFSIPIPTYVYGGTSLLPPTSRFSHPGVSCEVTYALSIRVNRKGLRLHKTLKIPITYLPKTRPTTHPLPEIPLPSYPGLSSVNDDRIETFDILPSWPCSKTPLPEEMLPSVTLTVTSPLCYTAGEHIPIILTMTCRDTPMHNKLLAPNIDIQLVKQTKIWLKGGASRLSGFGQYLSLRDQTCTKARLCHLEEGDEGVSQLHYRLKAGTCGGESSWAVSKVVGVSYYIQVIIKPPEVASKYLPTFRRNITVLLTTDYWGALDTEMLAMDGLPVPALGLIEEGRELNT